jgi:CBS domain-containing protein
MEAENRVAEIAQQLREKKTVEPITVRQFLSWFGAQRRGSWTVQWIRGYLRKANLQTEPDFDSVYIDSPVNFSLISDVAPQKVNQTKTTETTESVAVSESVIAVITKETIYTDPTYRISKLAAASNKPVSVAPDESLERATALMLTHDFSQLPVMTSDREVKGIITWNSVGTWEKGEFRSRIHG